MTLSGQAIALLRAMRGSLVGCLDGSDAFSIDPGWTGAVPRAVADELVEAGYVEIDEDAPPSIPHVFRISASGRAYLESDQHAAVSVNLKTSRAFADN